MKNLTKKQIELCEKLFNHLPGDWYLRADEKKVQFFIDNLSVIKSHIDKNFTPFNFDSDFDSDSGSNPDLYEIRKAHGKLYGSLTSKDIAELS